jgi:hypothetical protein
MTSGTEVGVATDVGVGVTTDVGVAVGVTMGVEADVDGPLPVLKTRGISSASKRATASTAATTGKSQLGINALFTNSAFFVWGLRFAAGVA